MAKKKIYAPEYYKKFTCIADKCRHSCCIGWEIDIDEKTLEKYEVYYPDICKSIEYCGTAHFKLENDEKCPHLNEKGLCNIIIKYGEDYLSDICRLHPRFFNDLGEREEAGLGLVCEEACRIILEDGEPFSTKEIGESEDNISYFGNSEYSPIQNRNKIIVMMEEGEGSYSERIGRIKTEFSVTEDIHTKDEWIDILLSLEIMDNEWKNILLNAAGKSACSNLCGFDMYYERLFKYFVFRHVSSAENEDNLRARLSFCILSTEIIKYLFESGENRSKEALFDLARLYSSEIEYSEDNTAELIFEFESFI